MQLNLLKLLVFSGIFILASTGSISATIPSTSDLPPHITIIKAWRHGETQANVKNILSGGDNDNTGLADLTPKGKEQAQQLGEFVVKEGILDVIYTSDLPRALNTAGAVVQAYSNAGIEIEVRLSKQLREVLNGKFNHLDAQFRDNCAMDRFKSTLIADKSQSTDSATLKDKYRIWKIHPLAEANATVPGDIVDVEAYLNSNETRPETAYQLWQRINSEFIKIAKENQGKTVGISTHGAALNTLITGLSPLKADYLPPHFVQKDIEIDGLVRVPAAIKVHNCALVYLKYDSQTGTLELLQH